MLGINSARAFSSAVAGAGFSWLALPAAVLTYFLESEMSEKRERFFKEEFDKQALLWQGKIKENQEEILKTIEQLKVFKYHKGYKIKELKDRVADAQKEYCGARADYNTLKMAVK